MRSYLLLSYLLMHSLCLSLLLSFSLLLSLHSLTQQCRNRRTVISPTSPGAAANIINKVRVCVCVYICRCVSMCVSMCVYISVGVRVSMYVRVSVCVCTVLLHQTTRTPVVVGCWLLSRGLTSTQSSDDGDVAVEQQSVSRKLSFISESHAGLPELPAVVTSPVYVQYIYSRSAPQVSCCCGQRPSHDISTWRQHDSHRQTLPSCCRCRTVSVLFVLPRCQVCVTDTID